MSNERSGLAGLLALKAVCCGGLLLAASGASLGSVISSVAGNGWVQAGGLVLVAFNAGWWLVRRRRAKTCAYDSEGAVKLLDDERERERNSVPAE